MVCARHLPDCLLVAISDNCHVLPRPVQPHKVARELAKDENEHHQPSCGADLCDGRGLRFRRGDDRSRTARHRRAGEDSAGVPRFRLRPADRGVAGMRRHPGGARRARRGSRPGQRSAHPALARDGLCARPRYRAGRCAGPTGGTARARDLAPGAGARSAGGRRARARRPAAPFNPPAAMKRLLLLRHAKAEQHNKGGDHERELSSRGRKDAPRMGHVMDLKGYVPDAVLCSSSARTRETFELAKGELAGKPHVEFLNTLYLASAQHVLVLLRGVPDNARTALAIGHSPGLEECAVLLARRPREAAEVTRLDSLRAKFPTCALAVLDFRISSWSALAPGTGTLADFIRPKDLD